MKRNTEPGFARWRPHVHALLSQWHKDQIDFALGEDSYLLRKVQHERSSSAHSASRRLLELGLAALAVEQPQTVHLLRLRFLSGEKVGAVARKLAVAESTLYKLQQRAVDALTTSLLSLEAQARAARRALLEQRLERPTYVELIGVESQLDRLLALLIAPGPPWLIALEGLGGIGKTTLADALLRRSLSRSDFVDVGWVSARTTQLNLGGGLQPPAKPALTTSALLEALVDQLLTDDPKPPRLTDEKALALLQTRLHQSPHLIVIDNLETVVDVATLLPVLRTLVGPTKFLLTSRQNLYAEADVYHASVPALSTADALRLVRHEAGLRNLPALAAADDDDLCPLVETVGGNPLALRLVVGQMHVHALDVVLADLTAARGATIENLYTFIYRRAWDNLDEWARHALLAMPVAAQHGATLPFLNAITGLDDEALRTALDHLVALTLVDSRGDLHERRYTIHNLTRTFLQQQVAKWLAG